MEYWSFVLVNFLIGITVGMINFMTMDLFALGGISGSIFFKNSEIENTIAKPRKHEKDYYYKSLAEKLSYQKKLMVKELNKHGIQTVLTYPENLTMDTINKYLEVKSRGLI